MSLDPGLVAEEILELRTHVDVDMEKKVPCATSSEGIPCPEEAVWRGIAKPCWHTLNHCEEHYQHWRSTEPEMCRVGGSVRHAIDRIDWVRI